MFKQPTNGEESEDEEGQNNIRLIPAQLLFTLPKNYYRIAIAVEEADTERKSAYRTTMVFNDYRYDLAISDIIFASKIAPAQHQSPFNRGALEVVPHPLRRYIRSEAVPVYFEIYNLEANDNGISRYSVEYRIVPASDNKASFWDRFDGERPVVSSKFESSSHGTTDQVHVSINTDNLRIGGYDLLITVQDDITQAVVYRKDSFTIVE